MKPLSIKCGEGFRRARRPGALGRRPGLRAALVVGVDADCSGCFELGVLAFGVLVGSADAGVADDLAGNARGVFVRV